MNKTPANSERIRFKDSLTTIDEFVWTLVTSLETYEFEDLSPKSVVVAAEGEIWSRAALALVRQYAVARCKVKLSY